jgi:hypothetical protein
MQRNPDSGKSNLAVSNEFQNILIQATKLTPISIARLPILGKRRDQKKQLQCKS